MSPHVFFQLRRMTKALTALHTDVRKVFAMHGQQVAIEQALLCRFVIAELAVVHFGGWWRDLQLCLPMVVLHPMGEERRLLVEILTACLALEWSSLAVQSVDFHVIVEADFFIGCEITVCALILFLAYHILVVIFGVALQETT